MEISPIFILFGYIGLTYSTPQVNVEFPFPALEDNIIPYDSSTPFYKFDGIDYDGLPVRLKSIHYDCFGEHIRCIRYRNYFHYTCVFIAGQTYGTFYSMCQMELENCKDRVYRGYGIHGFSFTDDLYLYQGEGWMCEMDKARDWSI